MSVLQHLPKNARAAIIRLRSLGDCVLTTPAIALLNNARPDLEIAVVVEPRFAAVFRANPAIAHIVEPSISGVFGFHPHLCLNLHGGARSMWMTAFSGAVVRAGFAHHKGSWIYNRRIPRAQQILGEERPVHTAEHLASAMFHLGVPLTDIPRASLYAAPAPEARSYAVIHPVAATTSKTWSPAGFLAVGDHLQHQHGLEPIYLAGPGEDLSAFSRFRCIAGAPLEDTMSLLSGASLFVGNDSGPAHIAAAFGIPVTVLFGPSDPVTWAPWRTASEVLVNRADIRSIPVENVIAAMDRLRVRA